MNQQISSADDRVYSYLARSGPTAAADLLAACGISQPTLARAIIRLNTRVLRIGKGRATQYAVPQSLGGLGYQFPMYRVHPDGNITSAGTMISVAPGGFLCLGLTTDTTAPLYTPDFPALFDDVRPAGFLGRLIPRKFPTLGVPDDVRLWSAEHTLRYLTQFGADLPGDLVIGAPALQLLSEQQDAPSIPDNNILAHYDALAGDALLSNPGSSAAGEQPKFLARRGLDRRAVLVKFSPLRTDSFGERISDLLICEHLAHQTLRAHQRPAASSTVHISPARTFLEVTRFDRIGAHGRRGVRSLTSIDLEHDGILRSWPETSANLLLHRVITPALHEQILWLHYFGQLIANTDMHGGNCAFFLDGLRPIALAPTYDMLPMAYHPPHPTTTPLQLPPPPADLDATDRHSALAAATDFWHAAHTDARISENFRQIAAVHVALLKR